MLVWRGERKNQLKSTTFSSSRHSLSLAVVVFLVIMSISCNRLPKRKVCEPHFHCHVANNLNEYYKYLTPSLSGVASGLDALHEFRVTF